ncbi:MAG: hypothetical protein QHH14_12900, partial [Clostridiales bacterium]|nr:hypothetical protein [Clostridiales bacterium]
LQGTLTPKPLSMPGTRKLSPAASRGELYKGFVRKVYEVNPLTRPQCQGEMNVISFITDFSVVDRIIRHLKLSFVASNPPPLHMVYQEVLMAAERSGEYFS